MRDMASELGKIGYKGNPTNTSSRPQSNQAPRNNNYNNGYGQNRGSSNAYAQNTYNERKLDFGKFNIVDEAESVIKILKGNDDSGKSLLTTSQIRKFLTAVSSVRNKVDLYKMQNSSAKLDEDLLMEVKFLKVNILYQAARENKVKAFCEKSALPGMIDWIGDDSTRFDKFCKYVEALVAFHKFYGGKDK